MAVLSTINRYEGQTVRVAQFRGDHIIIDNKAMDSDLKVINRNTIDLRGHKHAIIAKDFIYMHRYLGGTADNYEYPRKAVEPIDCSSRNSSFGGLSWSDPTDPDRNYVINLPETGVAANPSTSRLSKLDRYGNITHEVNIPSNYGRIIAYDGTNLCISCAAGNYDFYTIWYNADVLSSVATVSHRSYANHYLCQSTFIHRDDTHIAFIGARGLPYYQDLTDKSTYSLSSGIFRNGTAPSNNTFYNTEDYRNLYRCNYTSPMLNGHHFGIDFNSTMVGADMSWCATLWDPNTFEYDHYPSRGMTIDWAPGIAEDLKKIWNISGYVSNNEFVNYKVSDTKFLSIQRYDFRAQSSVGNTYRPRWWLVETDPTDPTILHVRNAGIFDYPYYNDQICYDGNKIILVYESIALHTYKVDTDNDELILQWDINTTDMASAGLINGIIWWTNRITNALNYELESHILTVEDRFEQTEIVLEDTNTPQENKYIISIYDEDRNRIKKNIKLQATGAIQFDDGSTVREFETLDNADLVIPITVTAAAENYIKVTVL